MLRTIGQAVAVATVLLVGNAAFHPLAAADGDEEPAKEKWSWISPGVCIPWCEWGATCGCTS